MSTQLTPRQVRQLTDAHEELGSVLAALGVAPAPGPEPQWKADYRRMWKLLKDVERKGGDLSVDEWRQLGIAHGYDPRGLGGFFRGHVMEARDDRRVLTDTGHRWVRDWQHEFGK